jgi:hypothetical protein
MMEGTMNSDPNDPEMMEKAYAWARGEYAGEFDTELRKWLTTHHPEEYFEAGIAKLKAQGVEVTPELLAAEFPGLEFKRKTRLKGYDDPSLN